VSDIVGQGLGLDGTLAHPTIVPSTCSSGGQAVSTQ
jgi:hypothetical protein